MKKFKMNLRLLIFVGLLCGILYFFSTMIGKLFFGSLNQIDWIREVIISLIGRPLGVILCGALMLRFWTKEKPLSQILMLLSIIFGLTLIGPILGLILKFVKIFI